MTGAIHPDPTALPDDELVDDRGQRAHRARPARRDPRDRRAPRRVALSVPMQTPPARSRRGGTVTLALMASMVVSFLASAAAPTPLYADYADRWQFSAITTTEIFAVYAVAVLAALLTLSRISEHIGRKPVLLAALFLQSSAMITFLLAAGVDALYVGRILQGLATGGALGTLGAAMLDVDRDRGTRANSAAPGLGSGVGALLSGLVVHYLPAPTQLIYLVFLAVFVLQAAGVALLPETAKRRPGLHSALIPNLAVPARLRRPLIAVTPMLFATWSLGGFYSSLAPALGRLLTGSTSAVIGGLGLFILTMASTVTIATLRTAHPRTMMMLAVTLLVACSIGIVAAVDWSSPVVFFSFTGIVGVGFGAGFQGGLRSVVPLAEPPEHAGLLASIYVICYLGMGVPSVAAGLLVVHGGGLIVATRAYAAFVAASAVLTSVALALPYQVRAEEGREPS